MRIARCIALTTAGALLAVGVLAAAPGTAFADVDAGGNDAYNAGGTFVGNITLTNVNSGVPVSLARTNGQGVPGAITAGVDDYEVKVEIFPNGLGNGCSVIYSPDGFASQTPVVMSYDQTAGNNDWFVGTIPAEAIASTNRLRFYLNCQSYNLAGQDIYVPGNLVDFYVDVDHGAAGPLVSDNAVIDFTGFTGGGFAPSPAAGQLDSDLWRVTGLSDGDGTFGGTHDSGDFARGASTGGVSTGGVYGFTVGAGNAGLGFQPGSSDLTPGAFEAKLTNNTGRTIAGFDLAYVLRVLNNDNRSTSLTASYAIGGGGFTAIAALDYTSPEAGTADPWANVQRNTGGAGPTGLTIAPGETLTLRFDTDDVSGTDSRDELAIDDITLHVHYAVDVAVTNIVDDPAPDEGAAVQFTVTVTNADMLEGVDGVEVSALLPAGLTYAGKSPSQGAYNQATGLWTVGGLAPLGSATLTVDATVDLGTAGSTLDFTATVGAADHADVNPANNTATASVGPVLPTGNSIVVDTTADVVDTNGDCSLREAIQAANTNAVVDTCAAGSDGLDAITFDPAIVPGTIDLASPLTISAPVTVTGPGADQMALDGGDTTNVLVVSGGSVVQISGLTIAHGVAGGGGTGGLYMDSATHLTVDAVRFDGNRAPIGAALKSINAGGDVVVTRCTFVNNLARGADNGAGAGEIGSGGAIYVVGGPFLIDSSTFVENTARGGDGTGAAGGQGRGGAIAVQSAVRIVNSTFVRNHAIGGDSDTTGGAAQGGAIGGASNTIIESCTFADNTTAGGAGASPGASTASTLQSGAVRNSVVVSTDVTASCAGTTSAGFNLFATGADAQACNGGVANPSDVVDPSPGMGVLADNGGATQTVAPRTDSPAIDGGTCTDALGDTIATDQRGTARPDGGACDIGAYEGPGVDPTQDFGDAPAPYATRLVDDGPRHTIGGPVLGAAVDAEFDGLDLETDASGDDLDGTPDEDGVVFQDILAPGQLIDLDVTLSGAGSAKLDAWIDWNRNGIFEIGTAERIVPADQPLTSGLNQLSFTVPISVTGGTVFARFRVSTAGGLGPVGAAADGEVEDYAVAVQVCGDSVTQGVEVCDDGDSDDTHGCNNTCDDVATNWDCPPEGGVCMCSVNQYGAECDVYCNEADNCASDSCGTRSCNGTTGACELTDAASSVGVRDSFGVAGSAAGELMAPRDVAAFVGDTILVVDTDNDRVNRYDATSPYALTGDIGGTGAGANPGEWDVPSGVGVDPTTNHVFVTDITNSKIHHYDNALGAVAVFGAPGAGDGQLTLPEDVAADGAGFVYVADRGNDRVVKFATDGTPVPTATFGVSVPTPSGVAIAGGELYVVSYASATVSVFALDGTPARTFGVGTVANGRRRIALDAMGRAYVTEPPSDSLDVYSPAGLRIQTMSVPNGPNGVAVDAAGVVYVTTNTDSKVVLLEPFRGCDDGDLCTQASYCDAGACVGSAPVDLDCDDMNDCTVDACEPSTGLCGHTPVTDDPVQPCEDGDLCTVGDTCSSGICVAGPVTPCDDGNDCTLDACNPATGFCEAPTITPNVVRTASYSVVSHVVDPRDIAVFATGVYLADGSDNLIEEYDVNGIYVGVLATLPATPTGVAATLDGHAYGITSSSGTYFDASGAVIQPFGTGGQDLEIAPNGDVLVVKNTTVQRWAPNVTVMLSSFTGDWVGAATALTTDSAGNIFVLAGNVVYAYDAAGSLLTQWDGSAGTTGALTDATSIAVDDGGRVIVTEGSAMRFQRFTHVGAHIDTWPLTESPRRSDFDPAGSLYIVRYDAGGLVGVYYVPVVPCDDTDSCTGHDVCAASTCIGGGEPECGDGKVCTTGGVEACDDGGTLDGDGCSAVCGVEPGASCNVAEPSVCTTACGDPCGLFVDDTFDTNTVPGADWAVITDAPGSAVTWRNGPKDLDIENRPLLHTTYQVDPASYGTLTVTTTWRLSTGDQARIHTRSTADQDAGNFYLPTESVACIAEGGSIFLTWPGSPPVTTTVPFQNNDRVVLEMTDDGTTVTCRYENLSHGGAGFITGEYAGTHGANHVAFANATGSAYLEDVSISASAPTCQSWACVGPDDCQVVASPDGQICDDGLDNTLNSTCTAGVCGGGCGDGVVDPGETCDTGTFTDGCTALCEEAPGWRCFPNGLGGSVCDRITDMKVALSAIIDAPVYAGDNVGIRYDVIDQGPVSNSNVTLVIDVPAAFTFVATGAPAGCTADTDTVTCEITSISNGQTLQRELYFTLDPDYTGAGNPSTQTFTATVDGDRPENDEADNSIDTDIAVEFCGDDDINGPEQCDDGGLNADESAKCRDGSSDAALRCNLPRCNDGITDSGTYDDGVSHLELAETCDDKNDDINDKCPSGPQGTCVSAFCGDGYVDVTVPPGGVRPSEECDSAGSGTFAGCDTCRVRAGWTCDGLRDTTCDQDCGTLFDFSESAYSWRSPGDGFAYGSSATFGGVTGWETALGTQLPAAPVSLSMWRSVAIPSEADAQKPQLVIDYRLDATASEDCMKVYLTTKPDVTGEPAAATECTPTAVGHLVIELSGTQAPALQTNRVLTIALDATSSAANRDGLIITNVTIRSDADNDGELEHMSFGGGTCADQCVDVDGDLYGNATSADRTSGCTGGPTLDCDDTDNEIKPDIVEGAFDGSLACVDTVDNNCDGATDADDDWCYEDCGNFTEDGTNLAGASPGDNLVDCDDPNCTSDDFCTTPCEMAWSFDTGGAWVQDPTANTSVFKAPGVITEGEWSTAGTNDATRKLGRLDLLLPEFGAAAVRGPKPTLTIRFRMEVFRNNNYATPIPPSNVIGKDVFAVCVDVDNCQINLLQDVFTLHDTSTAPLFPSVGGWVTATVDLTPYLNRDDLKITLLMDTFEPAQTTASEVVLRIDRISLGSDVDNDGDYEGVDPQGRACDTCWDGDNDGWGAIESPDVRTCSATPGGICSAGTSDPACVDCDDTSATVNPGEPTETVCNDGKDNNCDGFTDGADSSCGSEDCANGQDDNGDNIVDCGDVTCAGDPACSPCYTGFTFESGDDTVHPAGFVAYGRDDLGSFPLFEVGELDGGRGWTTAGPGTTVADKGPNGVVRGWLVKRQVSVGSSLPSPAVEIVYSLAGATGVNIGVCFDTATDGQGLPSACGTLGDPQQVKWMTSTSTPYPNTDRTADILAINNSTYNDGTWDRAIIPITQGTHDIVVFFESTAGNNGTRGVFIDEVLVRSDLDMDWDGGGADSGYEAAAPSCDHCIDIDHDGYGDADYDIADLSVCPVPDLADCDDDDDTTRPLDQTPLGDAGTELCYADGFSIDNDCDGLVDRSDPDCKLCPNGHIEDGETCDDGNTIPEDGCDANCQIESGGVYVTEIHLPSLFGNGAEQWIELYNGSDTPLDPTLLNLTLSNAGGGVAAFDGPNPGCFVQNIPTIEPGEFYIIAFGAPSQGDFVDTQRINATCPGFVLDDTGDRLELSTLAGSLDVIDFSGPEFACLINNARRVVGGETKGRSMVLANNVAGTTNLNGEANDVVDNWCLAGPNLNEPTDAQHPNNHYSNTDAHYGSPGLAGGCAEVVCDGVDDDCDGASIGVDLDEAAELIDTDGDLRCDARDCQPLVDTCQFGSHCFNDQDGDGVVDCLDDCRDADRDGFGVDDGLAGTCGLYNGQPKHEENVCDDNFAVNPSVGEDNDDACIDGLDNDCDLSSDCLDTDCNGRDICRNETCSTALPVGCGFSQTLIANSNDFPVCNVGAVRPNSPTGPDLVFRFVAPSTGNVTLKIVNGGTRRHEMFITTGDALCTEASCANVTQIAGSTCTNGGTATLAAVEGQVYYIVVKSLGGCNVGPLPSVTFSVSCVEICGDDGEDEDADGKADCLDEDCVPTDQCALLDFDNDGVNNRDELICGTNPLLGTEDPAQDRFLNPDGDPSLNCVDTDDDDDGVLDVDELAACLDPASKNEPTHYPGAQPACDLAGVDANCNGQVDTTEFLCGTLESNCGNGEDDDTDGATDCDDRDCVPVSLCDFEDFDDDGVVNYVEFACNTNPLISASKPTPAAEGEDPDGDGLPSCQDQDDDGDGYDDDQEIICGSNSRDANDTPPDLDEDFQCDDVDPDDDGDGFDDTLELNCASDARDPDSTPVDLEHDADQDGQCNNVDTDDDDDGWPDIAEIQCSTDPLDDDSNPTAIGQDVDDDKICDVLDNDDDNDGWLDVDEISCNKLPNDATSVPIDTDTDGICNFIDLDDDGDNVPDATELTCDTDPLDKTDYPIEEAAEDYDHDDLWNCVDDDDDGDGLSDVNEAIHGSDRLNPDSDNDGLLDGEEDANDDGETTGTETSPVLKDSDFDGIDDNVELASSYPNDEGGSSATEPWNPDTDDDGILDGDEDLDASGSLSPDETNPVRPDSDGDDADDGYEIHCVTDPLDELDVPQDLDDDGECDGAQLDTDKDGVADGVENYCHTDPLSSSSVPSLADLADTDGDGQINCVDQDDDDDLVKDVVEQECGTNPRDVADKPPVAETHDYDGDGMLNCSDDDDDNDGVKDTVEIQKGWDPRDADTDDDGLSDGREVELGTDPNDLDSDHDGVQDGTEVGETVGTNDTDSEVFIPDADPTTVTDPRLADTDKDGLKDGEEDFNANGRVDVEDNEGDPLDPRDGLLDTDGDGLIDRDEINVHKTDPENPDTDGDTLDDKEELDIYFTDPLIPDTDGGGVVDGFEVDNATNPLDASDDFNDAVVKGDSVFNCSGGGAGALGFSLLLALAFAWLTLRRRRRAATRGDL